MKLLLDTHVLLWALADPARIADPVRQKLRSRRNTVFASVASSWEIEIKRALGKLSVPDDMADQLRLVGFVELDIRQRHVQALRSLPPLHRDPFDRMLVAQAVADGLVLVTSDDAVARYPVRILRA